MKIAIIGAGVAGVTLAEQLGRSGVATTLLEKSRGVGGRLSTRVTRDGFRFDHGAQFFTARTLEFRAAIQSAPWGDHVRRWSPNEAGREEQEEWYVGAPAMKTPLEATAAQMDIRFNTRITGIERRAGKWVLSADANSEGFEADLVVLSCPSAQARDLTALSERLQSELDSVAMEPCWALMVALDGSTNTPHMLHKPVSGSFSWIAQNSSKPRREQGVETWVAHATPQWSQNNLELDADEAVSKLWPELRSTLGLDSCEPIYIAAHRWRYARVARPAGKPFLSDETGSLFAIGDWCLGPRVECAYLSGLHASKKILDLMA